MENSIKRVMESCTKLVEPSNLFAGYNLFESFFFDNILIFHRKRYRELTSCSKYYDYHHRFVLIVPIKGKGKVGVDRDFFDLYPGIALLLFPYQMHYYPKVDKDHDWLYITFLCQKQDLIIELKNNPKAVPIALYSKISEIVDLYTRLKGETIETIKLVAELHDLLIILTQQENGKKESKDNYSKQKMLIKKVDDFIAENISKTVQVNDIGRLDVAMD